MYAVEYSFTDFNNLKRFNLWLKIGIFFKVDNLITLTEKNSDFTFKREGDDWLMFNRFDNLGFKLNILKSSNHSQNKNFFFESTIQESGYTYSPKYESYLIKTNESISLHRELQQLKSNMNLIYPENAWAVRIYSPSPWNLNIKDALCTL